MRRYVLFFLGLLLASPLFAQALDRCRKNNPGWLECRVNSDCVIISNPCGHPTDAANARHRKLAEACNAEVGRAIGCPSSKEKIELVPKAICQNKVCSVEKITGAM